MLVEEKLYNWSRWVQPTESFGTMSITEETRKLTWLFDRPFKIYEIEILEVSETIESITIYSGEECTNLIAELNANSIFEPNIPICVDSLIFCINGELESFDLNSIKLIAEIGERKTILTPYLNTSIGMTAVTSAFNDDSTYTLDGLTTFKFNNVLTSKIYVSSNHWFGFGVNSEQLKVLNRDGCSTAIYRQSGNINGLEFLKIRFEGYTVYNNRVESNRLIFELFMFSNNDMFLNAIQTPANANTGVSSILSNDKTTDLVLHDGVGGGKVVSFYHKDINGLEWDILYADYSYTTVGSYGYLIKSGDKVYTIQDENLLELEIENITALSFYKYGFQELPISNILLKLDNPEIMYWKARASDELIKATLKVHQYPQKISSVIDISHTTILGISGVEAIYTGVVSLRLSFDNGTTFEDEILVSDFLNANLTDLYNRLSENKILHIDFYLHQNATLTSFNFTYLN